MKLFGTAINYGFGEVEETGILIAVDEILEDKRVRHIDSYVKEHPEASISQAVQTKWFIKINRFALLTQPLQAHLQ